MNFLEKDLEDIIFETPNKILRDRYLAISGHKLRQLNIGNYGVADIVTYERGFGWRPNKGRDGSLLNITVYELKKDSISDQTFWQGLRYLKGIQRYLDYRNIINYDLNLTLIGRDVCPNSTFVYMEDFFQGVFEIYTYDYMVDGLYFNEESGYKLKREGWGDEQ